MYICEFGFSIIIIYNIIVIYYYFYYYYCPIVALYDILMLVSFKDNMLLCIHIFVVKYLRTIVHAQSIKDFCDFIYVLGYGSSFCRLVERGLGIIPVADIVTGTTYTALCFHKLFDLDCEILVLVTFFVKWFLQVLRFWNSHICQESYVVSVALSSFLF